MLRNFRRSLRTISKSPSCVECITFASEETKITSVDALKKLREISKPYLLRRKHNEIDMSDENKLPQLIYTKILQIDKLKDNSEFFQFARLTILKKVCNHPRLLMEADGGSNAIEQAKNQNNLVPMGHKMLVFTQTHKMSGIIEETLKSDKLK
ncbi:hypothetical protein LIER_41557 [Lithospermum erythrorhizon]|uniref:Uncharacterized protein n=1 Tax=Lithospermum erythrorhizon TaxID=34254 RepID=A0AAV3RCQ5_LITER